MAGAVYTLGVYLVGMLATIYTITHPAKPKDVYVGQTTNPARRWSQHRVHARSVNSHLYRWWRARERTVIATFETDDPGEAKAWMDDEEIRRISSLRTVPVWRCLNSTAGGDGALDLAHDVRARISAANKGRVKSLETRAKLSAAHTGRQKTAETIAKMSAALRGRKLPPETRAKMSAARKGKKLSAETRAKMSAAQTARGPRPALTAEHKQRIANAVRAARKCIHGDADRSPKGRCRLCYAEWYARSKARAV